MGCGCRGSRGGARNARTVGPLPIRNNNSTTISNQSTRNNVSIQAQAQGEVKINGMTKAQRDEERKKRIQNVLKQRRTGQV